MFDFISLPLACFVDKQYIATNKNHCIKISQKQIDALANANIFTLLDFLLLLPQQIIDKRHITKINQIQNFCNSSIQIEGKVTSVRTVFRNRSVQITLSDDTGLINISWFNSLYLHKKFTNNMLLRCYGEVKNYKNKIGLIHPSYQIVTADTPLEKTIAFKYPAIKGITNKTICRLNTDLLALLKTQNSLADLHNNLQILHSAEPEPIKETARKAIAQEELLAYKLTHSITKTKTNSNYIVNKKLAQPITDKFIKGLKFQLTNSQQQAFKDILADLTSSQIMARLVQGDVGCGKTVIAVLSALCLLNQGYQVCLLAPTAVLAKQHFDNFINWLGDHYPVLLLTAGIKTKEKLQIKQTITQNKACMLIGTHALLTKDVEFKNLALIIVDEQHRFGVLQRNELVTRYKNTPHQLFLTATPIPRTLLMGFHGDMAVSNITELPKNRQAIGTKILPISKRDLTMERLYKYCTENQKQAYWVCTLIDESDKIQSTAAYEIQTKFTEKYPQFHTEVIHGKLKEEEKQKIISDLNHKKYLLLIATTVIEVGIHIEDAAIMVIENPERLGLAQLHQLRGRVGRSNQQAFCILLVDDDLSPASKERLTTFAGTTDGFVIAEYDFQNRGSGNLFGTNQSGQTEFRVADLQQDLDILKGLKNQNLANNPNSNILINRWFGGKLRLAES